MSKKPKTETAVFGGGCFWGVEVAFSKIPEVIETEAGYMGHDRHYESLSYEDVCSDETGYVEVVKVTFDPEKLDYNELLETFWKYHDPTTLNRQGPDVGTQYRSVIFYFNDEQKKKALASKTALQKKLDKLGIKKKVVTAIEPAGKYFKAEEYHQKYLQKRGQTSCHVVNYMNQ